MNNLILMTEYIAGRMRRIFFMAYPESRVDYKKSRICYTMGDSMSQTIAQLSGGTFLVMLMEALGISDGNMGIISSFACFAAVMQLASIWLSGKMKKNKLLVCLMAFQRIWLAFIFFIPLLHMEQTAAKGLMTGCYCFAQLAVQLGNPASVDWIASLTPERVRGRYFAIKDAAAVLVIIISTLIMGVVVDYARLANPSVGFVAVGAVIGVMVLIQVIAFSMMKEPRMSCVDENGKELTGSMAHRKRQQEKREKKAGICENRRKKENIFQDLKEAFGEVHFRRVLWLNGLWVTAFYAASPFNASYQVKTLQLPYTYLMLLSFITSILRIYLAPKAGKLADRIGISRVLKWTFAAMGIHFLAMTCSVPANAYVMAAIAALFSSLGWVFVGTGLLGLQLEAFPEEKRITQYALFSIISGIYGFLVSIAAGRLIDFLQEADLVIGGVRLYAQQITNIIGVLFIAAVIFYLNLGMWDKKPESSFFKKIRLFLNVSR